jgi:ankyrin repeat protein
MAERPAIATKETRIGERRRAVRSRCDSGRGTIKKETAMSDLTESEQKRAQDDEAWMRGQQLIDAARAGDSGRVAELLALGASALEADMDGETALMRAARAGSTECARLLLPTSDAKALTRRSWSALLIAVENGHEEVAELLAPLSDANHASATGDTPLMEAARRGHTALAARLAERCCVKAANMKGETALMLAILGGHDAIALNLAPFSDKNARQMNGYDALTLAAGNCQPETLKALLAAGFLQDDCQTDTGMTPLMAALSAGRAENADVLLPFSDPTLLSSRGETTLMFACVHGTAQMEAWVERLVSVCDARAKRKGDGHDALMAAARHGSTKMTLALLAAGADPLARDFAGSDALTRAVEQGHEKMAAILAPLSDLDAKNYKKQTVEDVAIERGSDECLSILRQERARRAAVVERGELLCELQEAAGSRAQKQEGVESRWRKKENPEPKRKPLAL